MVHIVFRTAPVSPLRLLARLLALLHSSVHALAIAIEARTPPLYAPCGSALALASAKHLPKAAAKAATSTLAMRANQLMGLRALKLRVSCKPLAHTEGRKIGWEACDAIFYETTAPGLHT